MALTHEQRDELQLLRQEDSKLMLHKLDTVIKLAESSDRALKGHNSTPGMVADMAIIKPLVVSMDICLNGNPNDNKDSGIIGEHQLLMTERETKKDNSQWLLRLVIGFIVLEVLAGVVVLIVSS